MSTSIITGDGTTTCKTKANFVLKDEKHVVTGINYPGIDGDIDISMSPITGSGLRLLVDNLTDYTKEFDTKVSETPEVHKIHISEETYKDLQGHRYGCIPKAMKAGFHFYYNDEDVSVLDDNIITTSAAGDVIVAHTKLWNGQATDPSLSITLEKGENKLADNFLDYDFVGHKNSYIYSVKNLDIDLSLSTFYSAPIGVHNIYNSKYIITYGCYNAVSIKVRLYDIIDMWGFFQGSSNVQTIDLSKCDTSNTEDMCSAFRELNNLSDIIGISDLDTGKVTNMLYMFYSDKSLTKLDLSKWDVSNVKNIGGMFSGCNKLTTTGDLSNWKTHNTTSMSYMFYTCKALTNVGDLSNWDVSNVTTMYSMFHGCNSLTNIGNLSKWNTGSVTTFHSLFTDCLKLEHLDISSWDVSNATDMTSMFSTCYALTDIGDLSKWNVSKANTLYCMFYNCQKLATTGDLSKWDVSNVADMTCMFSGCSALTYVGDLSKWNLSKVTSLRGMFCSCNALTSIGDLSEWDISNIDNLKDLFNGCNKLESIGDLSKWNTSKVTDMSYMFCQCNKLELSGIDKWNTSNVIYLNNMFQNNAVVNDNIIKKVSTWDVHNVTNIEYIFNACTNVTDLSPLKSWTFDNLQNISSSFSGNTNIDNLDFLESWDLSHVTSAFNLFYRLTKLSKIPQICLSKVTSLQGFFNYTGINANLIEIDGECFKFQDVTSISNFCINNNITKLNLKGSSFANVLNSYVSDDFSNKLQELYIDQLPTNKNSYLNLRNSPIILDSVKYLAETTDHGESTIYFSSTTKALDGVTKYFALLAAKGYTVEGYTSTKNSFTVDAGEIQSGYTVTNVVTGETPASYESDQVYALTSVSGNTIDFSNRNFMCDLDITDMDNITTVDISNCSKADLTFNTATTNNMVLKVYGSRFFNNTKWKSFITTYASSNINRTLTIYFGEEMHVGSYNKFVATTTDYSTVYVTYTFKDDGTYTYAMNNCELVEITYPIYVDEDNSGWIESTYDAPSDADNYLMYMSNSNKGVQSSMSKCYVITRPEVCGKSIDIYINSYAEGSCDYTIAFNLDVDYTSTDIPSQYTSGVIAYTSYYQKDPSGSISTNYKKVTYNIPDDGNSHKILLIYRKDGSADTSYDRGFVLIPTNV